MSPDAGHVLVRLHGGLDGLGGASELAVPVGGGRSVKDAVESVGVPHTEVGLLRVDGVSVGFGAGVRAGERVDVQPEPVRPFPRDGVRLRPPTPVPLRFVADVHLGTLVRRLRALGFDTWWRNDAGDEELAAVAAPERRVLLTRDRGLLMRRAVVHGHLPRDDDLARQLAGVVERFDLRTRAAPLTRCIRCNGRLARVARDDVVDRLPPATRREHDRFAQCDRCGRVYWPGSHVRGLHDVLRSTVER